MEPHVNMTLKKLKSDTGLSPSDILAKVAYCIQRGEVWNPDDRAA